MSVQKVARLVMLSYVVFLPAAAWAQVSDTATIAGVVKDTSGAVMPGVTVEAGSPALIEKVRSVVTDAQGQYKIVDLRPGTYLVTFSLPGFSTVKREGLELTTSFTATVNGEMKVGALEETVTVSGQAPVVDTQNNRQQTTIARATLDAIPSTGRLSQYGTLIPGAVLGNAVNNSVGGLDERAQFAVHGGRSGDNAPLQDGMSQRLQGGAIFVFNNLSFQEVVVETSGMSAERNTGGVQMNIVPKDGGNRFSGSFFAGATGPSLQSDNIDDALRSRGLVFAPSAKKSYDVAGVMGGPIKRDALWFFGGHRRAANQQYQQGNYFNKLTTPVGTDPVWKVLLYQADLSRPAYTDDFYHDYSLRLTWQAAEKHKIVAGYEVQPNCSCYWPLLEPPAAGPLAAPEAVGRHNYLVNYLPLFTWTFPATNRLLIEAGVSGNVFDNNTKRQDGVGTDTIGITDLATNFRYGSRATGLTHSGGYRVQHNRQYHQRFAVSYITGSHAFKSGLDLNEYGEGDAQRAANDPNQINGARGYTFRGPTPQSVTIWAVPFEALYRARDLGFFAQDQWTVRKLTLNLGLRYNNFRGSVPEQHMPAGPFVAARDFAAITSVPNFNNLNPRLGAAYDLFGNGKTALKVSLGRYTPYSTAALNNPAANQAASTTRTWNDANGNYVTDCDLRNPAINGECGAWNDLTFGQLKGSSTRYADDALTGFNRQSYSWQGGVSIQHELRRNVALNVGYFRTWYGGFLVTDNQLTGPANFDPYCIAAPADSRLPGGGGNQVCGNYDVTPTLFGKNDNLVTLASNYGNQTEVYNGVDATVNTRFGQGGQFSGGLSLGRTVTDNCYQNSDPSLLAQNATATTPRTQAFCHVSPPLSAGTQVKFLVVYPLPWNFQTSATYQNIPGIPITSSYVRTSAQIAPSLGRNLAAGATATATTDVIPSGLLYEDRLQQVDLRFSRVFPMGRAKVRANFDVYNMFNKGNVLNMTTRYGTQWLQPVQILGGRLLKVSGQFDF